MWQGLVSQISKETILSYIGEWNKAALEEKHSFLYELCEDPYIQQLLADYQFPEETKDFSDLISSIEQLEEDLDNIVYFLKDLREDLLKIRGMKNERIRTTHWSFICYYPITFLLHLLKLLSNF